MVRPSTAATCSDDPRDVSAHWQRTAASEELSGLATPMIYQIADRLHEGRTVRVPGDDIVTTVSAWLAELDTESPMVEDLAHAVCADDWPAVSVIGERLSIDETVAA